MEFDSFPKYNSGYQNVGVFSGFPCFQGLLVYDECQILDKLSGLCKDNNIFAIRSSSSSYAEYTFLANMLQIESSRSVMEVPHILK